MDENQEPAGCLRPLSGSGIGRRQEQVASRVESLPELSMDEYQEPAGCMRPLPGPRIRRRQEQVSPRVSREEDPVFFELTKLIEAVRAVQNGETSQEYDDDDSDEENYRYLKGQEVDGSSRDFILFIVYGSDACEEGDEVYSMSAQWNKLRSLVDNPNGGLSVSQLFQELFKSCVDDVEEDLLTGFANLNLTDTKKIVRAFSGTLVSISNKKIYNVKGSSVDTRESNWREFYYRSNPSATRGKCFIESANPDCGHTDNVKDYIVGGHMWSPELKKADNSEFYYILPICKRHNKKNVYDEPKQDGSGWLKATSDAVAMRITADKRVPGWGDMVRHLKGISSNATSWHHRPNTET